MSKEKQIEEIAKHCCNACEMFNYIDLESNKHPCALDNDYKTCHLSIETAEKIYSACYRKQSEGEWHYNPDGMDWGLGAWQCSLCGCKNDNLPMDKNIKPLRWAGSKYCPNCGAKMKGGE